MSTENYKIADWLLNHSNFSWLELDIEVDLTAWKRETAAAQFVDHRALNIQAGTVVLYTALILIKQVHGQTTDIPVKKMFLTNGLV